MKAFVSFSAAAAAAASLAFTQGPTPQEPVAQAPAVASVEVKNPAFPTEAPPPPPPAPEPPRGRPYTLEELAPYFAEGKLKQAREAFDAGHYTRARKLLEGQGDSLPVRYLRALSAVRAGDDATAAEEMAALAEAYRPLRDRCLTHAGVALEALGRHDEAAALLAQVPEGSRLYADARLALGRVLRKQKQLDAALEALAPLASQPPPSWGRNVAAEALLATADIAAQKKDRTREREALWRLWSLHPLSPLAKQAERRLGKLKPPVEREVARGEQLVELHRNRQGLQVLAPLVRQLALPDPLACRAHFAYGRGLRKERQHSRAISVLTPVVEKCEDPELLPRALYVLGFSRSIVDQQGGPETYERLARDFPAHSYADDALFLAADLYVKTGRPEQASQRLKELVRLYPQGDFLGEALFKDFWISRREKAPDGGLPLLEELEKRFAEAEDSYDMERARYWRARTLQERGEPQAAAELFERVALEHPASYYGLMARMQLAELEPARWEAITPRFDLSQQERRGPWPLYSGTLEEDPHFLAGVELLRLGFPEAAPSELLAVERAGRPAESIRLIVHLLALAGDERAAHGVARVALRRDLSGPITPETRPVWEVAYPNAFRELIEKHTAVAGVEPDLLQALMREESALDPKALSWAGALGLTQLMPSTAQAVARQLKLKRVTPDRLLDPELNIRLGAHYLGSLLRRFSGHTPYAVGSYNAGPLAIDRWRSERPGIPLDAWVEEVPIAETRGYIKRVLRSYNTYQLLYGRPARVPAIQAARR
jgi:soluble lytic murein transglycosylase